MADPTEQRRERELVLAPNEFAYISDETKGNVDVYVGPHKTSLAVTDQPVIFNTQTKRFERTELRLAIQTRKIAPEGWYLVLKNPSKNGQPKSGSRQASPEVETGRKVNMPGPADIALWPGQMAKVLRGHHIRSNQYLVARVYDEDAARGNWKDSVVIKKNDDGSTTAPTTDPTSLGIKADALTIGKLLIIKGTDVSFFIPPTGIEVVPDEAGKLERDAVTLERLEYCLLLNENGEKRYVQGPAVVFPEPTEVFVTREKKDSEGNTTGEKTRKFRAIELSPTSGLYVKVIADYEDAEGEHRLGDELFITGDKTAIYYPREEHAIIKYGDQEVHFATAIPDGEARYVMNRNTGVIRLVKGPTMFLPDPRNEVITRRVLDAKTCELLYPGNTEALQYNLAFTNIGNLTNGPAAAAGSPLEGAIMGDYAMDAFTGVAARGVGMAYAANFVSNSAEARGLRRERTAKGFTGDGFDRKNQYTEPRTIVLNTKYAGAVTTTLWNGFAAMLVRKSGERRVVVGPQTVHLEYDETPQVLELSTGKPKTTDSLYRTVFLRVKANKISDVIEVETNDFVKVSVKVSYRADFEGDDPSKWFAVDNYVKFMCDHLRSRVRSAVRKLNIEQFYLDSESVLRDIILGRAKTDGGKRDGTFFEENNLRVYDVEILAVDIRDTEVQKLLISAQREAIDHQLALKHARRNLDFTKENELIKQEKATAEWQTRAKTYSLAEEELNQKLALDLAGITAKAQAQAEEAKLTAARETAENAVHQIKLERVAATDAQRLDTQKKDSELKLQLLAAEIQGHVERAKAVTPDLVAALDRFGERAVVQSLAEAMAPLSIIGGGKSVVEIVAEMLKGTVFAKQLTAASTGNGRQEHQASA